ncbi:Gfo/Idh/MocA family oxidoreductase [Candidatus Bathyarchaeota archaeon]|nr:Gfo/Idh/MocA family oxidoreductase [Candidatus Bathyarchaeota archaeon]
MGDLQMVKDRVRICFIGCGHHSMESLQPAVTLIPQIEYVAACDLIEERAKEAVRRFGAKKWYTDYNEMISEVSPDGVIIVGPPQMHEELGTSCLKMGLNVFMEKPPSLTLKGARRIYEAMKESGKICMVGTHWRHMPIHRALKKISEREDFGEVFRLEATYLAPDTRGAWGQPFAWGFMLNQAIHLMDCLQFLGGRVVEVEARGIVVDGKKLAISASLEFASGSIGSFVLGGCSPIFYERIGIQGTEGWVEAEQFKKLKYASRKGWMESTDPTAIQTLAFEHGSHYRGVSRPGYVEELEHFAQSIISGSHPHADAEDAYYALKTLDAIVKSINTGKKIRVD